MEKQLINDAFKYAKNTLTDINPGHLEFINDIEEDILKRNILLSRTQIDVIVYYLDDVLQIKENDRNKISNLQDKLNALSDLP